MNALPAVTRGMRFVAAGLSGFVVQLLVLAGLTQLVQLHYAVATAVAVEAAILCNFVWHERWTWRDRPAVSRGETWRRLGRFHALTAVTSILGTTVLTATLVEATGLPLLVANSIAVVVLGVANFAGSETLVFRVAAFAAIVATGSSEAATLTPKAAKDFSRYATAVEARIQREVSMPGPFLKVDRQSPPDAAAVRSDLRRGSVLVLKATSEDGSGNETETHGGSIHHWRGMVFIPNVTLDHVLRTLKEPDQHKQEDVVAARVLRRNGDDLKLYLRLKRTQIVTVVYDTEHEVRYRTLGAGRAVSSSVATRIVEVENAGTPSERALPAGDDHGFLWRLNSYWRYQAADGGVYVELESVTLSQDLPFGFKSVLRPLVDRVAEESIRRTLESTRGRFMATATAR